MRRTPASGPQLPLPSLLLTLLLGLSGVIGQEELQVAQPGTVSVKAGETVNLSCVLSSPLPVGPIQWFRGAGPDQQLVYNFRAGLDHIHLFPRVRSLTDQTKQGNLDYSISISNITPADTGTYFCVKFRKGSPDVEYKSGPGTRVTVSAKPSAPVVLGPPTRTTPGHRVSFTCQSHGFSPRDVALKWLKNGNELLIHQEEVVPTGDSVSYSVSSTAQVMLTQDDVHSQVICEVAHMTLQGSLRGTANLSETIRVPPTLEIMQIHHGNEVDVSCQVKKFYPENLNLTWLENGIVSRVHSASILTEDKDGTYNLKSWILVMSSALREDVVLTCHIVHDGQPAVTKQLTVTRTDPEKDVDTDRPSGLLMGFKLLLLLLVGVSIFYVHRKQTSQM
ncbi:PREDICTED: signal-regulatory protein beta-1 isoform 3-like [Elephantulus edwardii]|uniref:signal-regulatory protein beta-1 isoform 3-like n=1 Tax=Elephantulus edwardii TaxID=28737 RepID=UPI0003F07391|nr:PREDICTED: signal-regulatory protein beta-1 isoform 3-like [Elephantulus edwardii]